MGLGVVVKDGDVNKALNILKYKCKKFDLYNEIKKHLEYTKPSDVRREEKKKGLKLHKRIERQKRNEEKL